ncbi:MAG: hypothetical protein AAFY34_03310 [Pseudomonadota bacterium]
MKLRKLMLAGGAVAALASVPAQGAVVDNPQFRVLGLVIVWGADGFGSTANAPVVSDFVIDNDAGSNDADLITTDVHTVVTGSLTPTTDAVATNATPFDVTGTGAFSTDINSDGVLDASDTFGAFTLNTDNDIDVDLEQNSSFYVASNTAFSINGSATAGPDADTFTLDDISWTMTVQTAPLAGDTDTFGGASQDPQGVIPATVADLGDFGAAPGALVYDGTAGRATAATPGTILEQSVRFDVTYTLGTGGYDLSQGTGQIEADVVYTVFVP